MKRTLIVISITMILALSLFAAEDKTETTPPRLGPAVGIQSTPLSVGYRMPLGGYYSLDMALHVPEYVKCEDGYSGMLFGAMIGYLIPMRLEENFGFVVRPQLDFGYQTQSMELNNEDYKRNVFMIRPGAYAGMEIFLEEVGVDNVNISIGFTAGLEYQSINVDSPFGDEDQSTVHIPMASSPFGASVSIWWYF